MVQYPDANHPRFGTESRTVRASGLEPSTLRLNIADGSILQDRTFHVNAPYHGWFSIQARTLHALGLNHGQFDVNRTNLPRGDSISRTVPFSKTEPSTKTCRIMEGSASRAEPSALKPEIVEGSIPQTHSADPSSRPVLQARTPPLSDPVPSIQYAGWHGTYH